MFDRFRHSPWHGCVHRLPSFWFGVAFFIVGLFDSIGQDAIAAFLTAFLGQNASAKALLILGVAIPALRFITVTPLLAGLRHPSEEGAEGGTVVQVAIPAVVASLFLYFGLPFGGIAIGAAAFFFLTPWGPPALALIANSKIARFVLAAGGIALAIGLACLKAFNAGKAGARAEVDQANAEAKAERQEINATTAGETDAQLRSELGRWSPR